MDTVTAGSMMGILILLQMAIIRECIRMKSNVASNSQDLKTDLTNIATLLDEAIDFLADSPQPNPVLAQAGTDFKEMALTAFMQRMLMQPNHGTTQEPQERPVYEDDSQTPV